jgi:hypothetical protein
VNLVAVLRRNSHSASQDKKKKTKRKKKRRKKKKKEKKGKEFLLPISPSVSAPYSYLWRLLLLPLPPCVII